MSKKTRQVQVGSVRIGGGAPVSVQSMTNTDTADVEKTLSQIRRADELRARTSSASRVYNEACADAVRALVDGSPVPLVADIHFDYKLAIKAVENGIHKLRINPGNIGGEKNVQDSGRLRQGASYSGAHRRKLRLGREGYPRQDTAVRRRRAWSKARWRTRRMLEDCGFYDMVLSMKASNVPDTVAAYRLANAQCDYPLHLGVTEAGSAGAGQNQERDRHRLAAAGWHRRHDPRVADGRPVPRAAGRHRDFAGRPDLRKALACSTCPARPAGAPASTWAASCAGCRRN